MNSKQMLALFIIVVMGASPFAYLAFYGGQPGDGGDGTLPPDGSPTDSLILDYVAENVETRVMQLLSRMRVVAETEEADLAAVTAAVYDVEGVKDVMGNFQKADNTKLGRGFVYVADISFERDYNSEHILEGLESETSLQHIIGLKYALLELPETVKFANQDLNLFREHRFEEGISEAMVEFPALPGDELLVTINATFEGGTPLNWFAFESENKTAAPVHGSADLTAPVASLEKTLLFSGEYGFTQLPSIDDLNKQLQGMETVVDSNLDASAVAPAISINSEGQLTEEEFQDLNAFLHGLGAESVAIANSPLYAYLPFADSISQGEFSEKLQQVGEKAEQLGIDANVDQGRGFFFGQVELSTADSSSVGSLLAAFFSSNGLEAGVQQPAELTVEEIAAEGDSMLPVEGGVAAFLLPGHSIGEEVSVKAEYFTVRGKIAMIQAIEE